MPHEYASGPAGEVAGGAGKGGAVWAAGCIVVIVDDMARASAADGAASRSSQATQAYRAVLA